MDGLAIEKKTASEKEREREKERKRNRRARTSKFRSRRRRKHVARVRFFLPRFVNSTRVYLLVFYFLLVLFQERS